MAKTDRMELWELRLGKPIQEILRDRFEQHGRAEDVAESLSISMVTLYDWLDRLDGEIVRPSRVRFASDEKVGTP